MIGACPDPLAAASSLLLRPLPPPRFCACLGTLGAPCVLPGGSLGSPSDSIIASRKCGSMDPAFSAT
eukprot:13438901-Heterocapsa_arctica.AAC.1